jgi:hypothetical protein
LADDTARYEIVPPAAVDLTVTIASHSVYRAYEAFLSSYFDKRFRPHVYLWARNRREHELIVPTVSDVFRETVLVFPRDAHSARHCLDGRWDRRERGIPVVQMCPVRHYAFCMGFMVDEVDRLGVVLMSNPADCYAISTRYHAENEADRMTSYSAFDLSLFGQDLLPDDRKSVKVRLQVTQLESEIREPLEIYRDFVDAPATD